MSEAGGLLGARSIRALADELGIRPTKQRGQNFVIDPNTVTRIVRLAGVGSGDRVLEIGPGLGSLTLALLAHGCRVIAVEIDSTLATRLPQTVAERLPQHADRLLVVHADALRIDALPEPPDALVANLPYNIAVPVLLHAWAAFESMRTGLAMVQKEVAERLAATPGSKTYGVPSVKIRWFADIRYAGDVSPRVFWPEPNVESGLVRLERHEPPACRSSRSQVFAVVDAAFGQRRKSLRVALAGLCGSPANAGHALEAAGLDASSRGETLAIEDFVRLSDAIHFPDCRAFPSTSA